MSEMLVRSKVRTNSFDYASLALILVNDDEAKIVKANRKIQIETLIAIVEFCVCVCVRWKSVTDGGWGLEIREMEGESWDWTDGGWGLRSEIEVDRVRVRAWEMEADDVRWERVGNFLLYYLYKA